MHFFQITRLHATRNPAHVGSDADVGHQASSAFDQFAQGDGVDGAQVMGDLSVSPDVAFANGLLWPRDGRRDAAELRRFSTHQLTE